MDIRTERTLRLLVILLMGTLCTSECICSCNEIERIDKLETLVQNLETVLESYKLPKQGYRRKRTVNIKDNNDLTVTRMMTTLY